MTTINIKLTIGNETREVDAYIAKRYEYEDVTTWASVTTTHGNRTHVGSLTFKRNETDEYNVRDCRSITYHGMRGNGHARRSQFRNVSFLPTEKES